MTKLSRIEQLRLKLKEEKEQASNRNGRWSALQP